MIRQLRVLEGPDHGKVFELPASGVVRIGRGADTFTRLTDRTVSRYHCQLEVDGDRVLVTTASESGTLVNDQRVTQQELREEDVIRLGDTGETRLVYEVVDIHAGATLQGGGDKFKQTILDEMKGLLGKTLAHFRVNKVLAEGSSSTVFLARDTQHNRDVALKVFPPGPDCVRTLPQAFQMLQPLLAFEHPHLVTLYETGQTGIHHWIAMEYVEGESLQKHLANAGLTGMIDWQHVLRIGIHLAKGLDALHQQQIIHRNITPVHVLLTRSDRLAKLGGLWRARADRDCRTEGADVKEVLHHLAYMPPERLRGGERASARGDIYSLGAVLYHLLAGRPPFGGQNDAEIINKIIQSEAISLKEFQLSLPDALERAIRRMLAKAPEDRFASASELLSALQYISRGEPATEAPPPQRPVPRDRQEHVAAVEPAGPAPVANAPVAFATAPPAPIPPVLPSAGEGKITVLCRCGQTLQARKQFAGTRVRCPCCGDFIDLPGRPQVVRPPQGPASADQSERPSGSSWQAAASAQTATALLHKVVRYIALAVLLVGTVVVVFSGMVCNSAPQSRPPEKTKPEALPKAPAQSQAIPPQQ